MRVLAVSSMYPPHHQGGYELMLRASVTHLRACGDTVGVLTTDHREQAPDPAIPDDAEVRRELRWYWRDHGFPRLSMRQRLVLERHNLERFDRALADLRPDVIAWWAMGGMSLSLFERARRAGVPGVAVVVDEWPAYARGVDAWQRAFDRGPLAGVAERLTAIPTGVPLAGLDLVFASEYLRQSAAAVGLDDAGATVLHPGIEPGRFAPRPPSEWEGRLLCLGRIDPRKGLATAIEALAELPGCSLRIVGTGDPGHLAELRDLADRLEVGDRVDFDQVSRSAVPAALAQADALLFCVSWPEPFGLVPLEAMAAGVPVVATATGGAAEYLADGSNCLVVEPGAPAAVAGAVGRLAAEPRVRAALRDGGLDTAARFTGERFDAGVRAVLLRAAKRR